MFSTRKDNLAPRFPNKTRPENPFFATISLPHQGIALVCGETERSELQGLARPCDTILINAQDATTQCGARTTQREAGSGIKLVRKHNNGKNARNDPNPDPPTGPCKRQEQQIQGRLWHRHKAFAPAIVGMSGQIHADFLRLLWVLADKQMRSYYESMGKEDKIGNEAFRWARAKVFNCNKTSRVSG